MKLKNILTDIRTYIGLVVFFAGITYWVITWAEVPNKVKDIESKTKVTDDKVQQLANSVNQYVEVEKVKDIEREKSAKEEKELMMKWIEAVSKR